MLYSYDRIMNCDELESIKLIALEQNKTIADQNEQMFKMNSLNPAHEPKVMEIIKLKDDARQLYTRINNLEKELKAERKSRKVLERLACFVMDSPRGHDEC